MKDIYAYPTVFNVEHGGQWETHEGMSLLDYFAGQVIGVIIADKYHENFRTQDNVTREYASLAYKVAEAMLVEREKYNKK